MPLISSWRVLSPIFRNRAGSLATSLALFVGALMIPTGSAVGRDGARSTINLGGGALAPFSYIVFCAANPGDCTPTAGAAAVASSDLKTGLISRVNREVNALIMPQEDSGADVWQADVASGDCEDYVLTKRRRLVALGVSARALRVAVGRTPSGEGHAVLVVATDRGDMIMDNRFDKIVGWKASDIHILKIQSAENPKLWFEVMGLQS